jgi:hypothetical protein
MHQTAYSKQICINVKRRSFKTKAIQNPSVRPYVHNYVHWWYVPLPHWHVSKDGRSTCTLQLGFSLPVISNTISAFFFTCFKRLPVSTCMVSCILNSSVFWVITRRQVVWNRRFGITNRSSLQASHPLKMGLISSPETSVSTPPPPPRSVITQKTEKLSSTAAEVCDRLVCCLRS